MNSPDQQAAQPAPAQYFTGPAWVKMLAAAANPTDCTVGDVLFEPGSRNNWHAHPHGQLLVITAGTGYYQEKGQPARRLTAGDTVVIAPNVVHWHGAAATDWFAHLAINPAASQGETNWLDPVSDADYRAVQ
ncbi:cupin domain-containing protein [Hymenobacter sp. BRD128]|uniref:(R)-mandelonitrile lyase n=1 Tax=Hymenobacter sp. BRD128 TaxID=2675878 RepID=UPI001564B47F|nr:cupin domain-containing protein [Hymenobacter sp. BRD128]QKG55839.1 cupin domain-containing protein [Hymenobacter sp. BRD128]